MPPKKLQDVVKDLKKAEIISSSLAKKLMTLLHFSELNPFNNLILVGIQDVSDLWVN